MNEYQISNIKSQISKKEPVVNLTQGFTLVELLIVIAMFAATGTVILSILFVSLRASNKSDKLISLKQSGNAVLSQMIKQIRYAKSLDMPSTCPVTPGTTFSSITITSIVDNAQTTFSCVGGPPATISSNSASLIDNGTATVTQCAFSCFQPTINDPPTINLSFTLSSDSSTGAVELTSSVPFKTSVTMRNYNK